jgi:SAM-dependent methyltransferase
MQDHYKRNLDFWETAWSRVKKASTKIPDIDYIPEIPKVFKDYGSHKILDLACGSGWLSFYLNEHGFKVEGLDISESGIKLGQEIIKERNIQGVRIQVGDILEINEVFSENNFDGALINACLEHLDYQRAELLFKKLNFVLRNEAVLFGVFDLVGTSDKGEYLVLEDGTRVYQDPMRSGMFLRCYSDEELEMLHNLNGFQIESVKINSYGSRIVISKLKK